MTQCDRILRHLESGGSLTAAQAMQEYGIPIQKRTASSKNRYGEKVSYAVYYLEV